MLPFNTAPAGFRLPFCGDYTAGGGGGGRRKAVRARNKSCKGRGLPRSTFLSPVLLKAAALSPLPGTTSSSRLSISKTSCRCPSDSYQCRCCCRCHRSPDAGSCKPGQEERWRQQRASAQVIRRKSSLQQICHCFFSCFASCPASLPPSTPD